MCWYGTHSATPVKTCPALKGKTKYFYAKTKRNTSISMINWQTKVSFCASLQKHQSTEAGTSRKGYTKYDLRFTYIRFT